MSDCMICDLYAVIDHYGDSSSDFVGNLVTVLPPRAHVFHKLGIIQEHYRSSALIPELENQRSSEDNFWTTKPELSQPCVHCGQTITFGKVGNDWDWIGPDGVMCFGKTNHGAHHPIRPVAGIDY